MTEAAGWRAIDDALHRLYGDVEPVHLATLHKWHLGGPDPLDGISAYPRAEPVPHWHLVSYGMSELYEKNSKVPEASGWGFEFTIRVAAPVDANADNGQRPPNWALDLMQNLARYVFNSGNWFEPGHYVDAGGPLALERDDSALRAIVFALDPELGTIETPHGRVDFLQIIGVTPDEYETVRHSDTFALLNALTPYLPLWVTDLDRASLLAVPAVAAAVRRAAAG
ncbi:MAG: hypothetical protein AUI14_04465 [Actinobacteria bacterium 13_2_20CM_2_71_6]|nr:MAG: hypothetical protein AUI14_04465 [Actinobacteria bacterium 13_2_20CM_2_71_6]